MRNKNAMLQLTTLSIIRDLQAESAKANMARKHADQRTTDLECETQQQKLSQMAIAWSDSLSCDGLLTGLSQSWAASLVAQEAHYHIALGDAVQCANDARTATEHWKLSTLRRDIARDMARVARITYQRACDERSTQELSDRYANRGANS